MFLIILFVLLPTLLFAQLPTPTLPKVESPRQLGTTFTPPFPSAAVRIFRSSSTYENYYHAPAHFRTLSPQVLQDIYAQDRQLQQQHTYRFPSTSTATLAPYQKAYTLLADMLAGKTPLQLRQAVFAVETAYAPTQINPKSLEKAFLSEVALLKTYAQQQGLDLRNKYQAHQAIFAFMTDTVRIRQVGAEKNSTHLPYSYDFSDAMGANRWQQQFVSKALSTHSGQCHSLPLLYLLFAEELGIEAHLSYAPNHSFIKLQDEKGAWWNLELTSGEITSDALMVQLLDVTAQAVQNRVYLDTLSKRQVVASCLVDLAAGHIRKSYYSDFTLQCLDLALEVHPQSISAMMLKSNYYTLLLQQIMQENRVKRIQDLPETSENFKLYELFNTWQTIMLESGHEDMTIDEYNKYIQQTRQSRKEQLKQKQQAKILIDK